MSINAIPFMWGKNNTHVQKHKYINKCVFKCVYRFPKDRGGAWAYVHVKGKEDGHLCFLSVNFCFFITFYDQHGCKAWKFKKNEGQYPNYQETVSPFL